MGRGVSFTQCKSNRVEVGPTTTIRANIQFECIYTQDSKLTAFLKSQKYEENVLVECVFLVPFRKVVGVIT